MNNYILITGVAGNIGSYLALSLLRKNYKVIGIDNFLTGEKKNYQTKIIKILSFFMEMLMMKKISLKFLNHLKSNMCFILLLL